MAHRKVQITIKLVIEGEFDLESITSQADTVVQEYVDDTEGEFECEVTTSTAVETLS